MENLTKIANEAPKHTSVARTYQEKNFLSQYMPISAEEVNCYDCNSCGSGDCNSCCSSSDD